MPEEITSSAVFTNLAFRVQSLDPPKSQVLVLGA